MQITTLQLTQIMPYAKVNVRKNKNWYSNGIPLDISAATQLLNHYAKESGITEPLHWVHFLANIAVESAELRYSEENLNYSALGLRKTWTKRFPTTEFALQFQYKPEKIANYVYAWRNGNGDEQSGDGWRYRGRGLIQYTGRTNYKEYARWCGFDVVNKPNLMSKRVGSFRSACHYFATKCLSLAMYDKGKDIRKRINGGLNGWSECERYISRAKKVLL